MIGKPVMLPSWNAVGWVPQTFFALRDVVARGARLPGPSADAPAASHFAVIAQRAIVGREARIGSEKSGASLAARAASLIRERRLNSSNGSVASIRPEW